MAKQKKGKQAIQATKQPSGIALAAHWPVHEVLVSSNWQMENELVLVLIARRSFTTGRVAAASLLVDLSCLGIKQAQVTLAKDVLEYQQGLRRHITSRMPMIPTDFNLAAKIVLTALEYAANLGFRPDPVFAQAQHLFVGADIEACTTFVRTGGPEGKPYFVQGPYDDPHKIVNQLIRSVGQGNFHYLIQGSKEELGLPDEIDQQFEESER
jgi:hypothetical protein